MRVSANEWKSRIDVDVDPANVGKPLEVQAFLQIMDTFRISTEFLRDDICKLVLVVSWGRKVSKLCGAFVLIEKMSGLFLLNIISCL